MMIQFYHQMRNNSDTVIKKRDNSDTMLQKRDNSETMLQKRDNSDTMIKKRDNSDTMLQKRDNSDTMLQLKRDNSDTMLQKRNNSETMLHQKRDNSDTMIQKRNNCDTMLQQKGCNIDAAMQQIYHHNCDAMIQKRDNIDAVIQKRDNIDAVIQKRDNIDAAFPSASIGSFLKSQSRRNSPDKCGLKTALLSLLIFTANVCAQEHNTTLYVPLSLSTDFSSPERDVRALEVTPHSALLKWRTTSDTEDILHRVTYGPLKARYVVMLKVPDNEVVLTKLLPNTVYTVTVTALGNTTELWRDGITFQTAEAVVSLEKETTGGATVEKDGIEVTSGGGEAPRTSSKEVTSLRIEEVLILAMVLSSWVVAIALFFNRWGKIRMLEPYQEPYKESSPVPGTIRTPCPIDSRLLSHPRQTRNVMTSNRRRTPSPRPRLHSLALSKPNKERSKEMHCNVIGPRRSTSALVLSSDAIDEEWDVESLV